MFRLVQRVATSRLPSSLAGGRSLLAPVVIGASLVNTFNSAALARNCRNFSSFPPRQDADGNEPNGLKRIRRQLKQRLERRKKLAAAQKASQQSQSQNQTQKQENDHFEEDKLEDEPERFSKKEAEDKENKTSKKPASPDMKFIEFELNLTQLLWILLGVMFIFSLLASNENSNEITYQEFKANYLDKGQVERLQVINNQLVRVYLRGNSEIPAVSFTIGSVESFERHLKEAQDALGIASHDRIPIVYVEEVSIMSSLFGMLPTLLFLGFLVWLGRRAASRQGSGQSGGGVGGVFGVGKSRAQLYDPNTEIKVRFSDVAGMDEAKTEIMEFVQFLKHPEKYKKLGANIPRGAILSGAPGTGKTLLAKATAGEAGVPFFSVSGSEFVEMFSGVGASRVRDLFKKAREKAPAMIWIDEIDAIGKARAGAGIRGGNDEREATLNQLLVEMDGFSSDEHVVVLAGTNRVDMLDKALLRPGRFDRHINIDLPTLEGRRDIYMVHLKSIVYDKSIPELAGKLAAMTPGFSGADIANCCNEAALAAAREGDKQVEMKHFDQAVDRVIAGLERRSRVLPVDKRKIVAYHEAGHAVAGWFLKYADPLMKVTIVPHGSAALGYAQLLPGDNNITTENRMEHLMTVALGGRVSEEIFFDSVTVGASDDFKRVTNIARSMVCDYGFSQNVGYVRLERSQGSVSKSYSDKTDALVDHEIKKIIDTAHERCKKLLSEKRKEVESVAEELLAKEMLTRADLVRLLGERPFKDQEHEAFKKYLDV